MELQPAKHPPRPSVFAAALRRWRLHRETAAGPERLGKIPVAAQNIRTLAGPDEFRTTLLELIGSARERIVITTLYLQDDDAGREVLSALYAAKAARPALQIALFVDWHRAQRGLIGKGASAGNAALYVEMARRLGPGVPVYGVPVHSRELMGVLHLKGFVIDDTLLYSGASLNDVYLHRHQRYRLDRYHLIENRALADSLAALMRETLLPDPAVRPLDSAVRPRTRSLRGAIVNFRRLLANSNYAFAAAPFRDGQVGITPLAGFGVRGNRLNAAILQLIARAKRQILLFTPYFNLPGPLRRALDDQIRQGCKVVIVLGDKTANDFYIPPGEPFSTIGALPYLYESNLRRFCQMHQQAVNQELLDIHLWRHDSNSFHLKGLWVDEEYALLTGSNLNPRAWRLDFENGLLIHDPYGSLIAQQRAELARILAHTSRLDHHSLLEAVEDYPLPVQRLLKRLAQTRADRLVNQVL